jgi:malonate-semialdehyde dehydrogenase (acetylating)/methylmalonate-semialdehyde dehydrogenase
MGPVVTPDARARIVGFIDGAERQGGKVLVDGRDVLVPGHERGFFVGPTVIDQVTPAMEVYAAEVFGPVLSVVHVGNVSDAIDLVNANPYGNGTSIFTNSGGEARAFTRGVKVGMVGVNVPVPVPMAYYSFGGWKDSLFGEHHVHGPDGVAFYTRGKFVTTRWPDLRSRPAASLDMPTAT